MAVFSCSEHVKYSWQTTVDDISVRLCRSLSRTASYLFLSVLKPSNIRNTLWQATCLSVSVQSQKASKVKKLQKSTTTWMSVSVPQASKTQRLKWASRTHMFVWFCSKSLQQRPDACLSLLLKTWLKSSNGYSWCRFFSALSLHNLQLQPLHAWLFLSESWRPLSMSACRFSQNFKSSKITQPHLMCGFCLSSQNFYPCLSLSLSITFNMLKNGDPIVLYFLVLLWGSRTIWTYANVGLFGSKALKKHQSISEEYPCPIVSVQKSQNSSQEKGCLVSVSESPQNNSKSFVTPYVHIYSV